MNTDKIFHNVFEVGEPTTYDKLPVDSIFIAKECLDDERRWMFNRYWLCSRSEHRGYNSPRVMKKVSETFLQTLMTDFPVPEEEVDKDKAKSIIVLPVKFIGK